MNHLREMERLLERSQRPGVFHRDHQGNEHELTGYIITLTNPAKGGKTRHAKLVIVAPSRLAAQVAATKPYPNATILSCEEHHLANPTVLRQETILEDSAE